MEKKMFLKYLLEEDTVVGLGEQKIHKYVKDFSVQ